MPWVTTYLFFLFIIIINKLFYEVSLHKPILSFVFISLLFATYFILLTYGDDIEIIDQYTIYRSASITQPWTIRLGYQSLPCWGLLTCSIVGLGDSFRKPICFVFLWVWYPMYWSLWWLWCYWLGLRFTKRFSMEVLQIGLFLQFFNGINKLYPMTFYKYPGCSVVITILL